MSNLDVSMFFLFKSIYVYLYATHIPMMLSIAIGLSNFSVSNLNKQITIIKFFALSGWNKKM